MAREKRGGEGWFNIPLKWSESVDGLLNLTVPLKQFYITALPSLHSMVSHVYPLVHHFLTPSTLWKKARITEKERLCNLEEVWWLVLTWHFAQILYQGICNPWRAVSGRHWISRPLCCLGATFNFSSFRLFHSSYDEVAEFAVSFPSFFIISMAKYPIFFFSIIIFRFVLYSSLPLSKFLLICLLASSFAPFYDRLGSTRRFLECGYSLEVCWI